VEPSTFPIVILFGLKYSPQEPEVSELEGGNTCAGFTWKKYKKLKQKKVNINEIDWRKE
jgi:hypothetical protein